MSELVAEEEVLFDLCDGRYAVLEPIGEGGMASVHRCADRQLGVLRAIKLRRVRDADLGAATVQRLADEARVMARLRHPHVLPVFDVGIDGGWQFVVMELARGGSLSDVLDRDGPLAPGPAVDLLVDVLDAVQIAHEAGIVHRDLKPHNILLAADGTALLADWGIARLEDRDHTLTRTGVAMGSAAYMAPEQRLDAHAVGPEADVYAAAATLYHMVTLASPMDLFTASPSSPRWEGVPAPLAEVLRKATAYEASERYPTATALIAALREIRDGLPSAAAARPAPLESEGYGTMTGQPATVATGADVARAAVYRPVPVWALAVAGVIVVAALVIAAMGFGYWLRPPPSLPVLAVEAPAMDAVVDEDAVDAEEGAADDAVDAAAPEAPGEAAAEPEVAAPSGTATASPPPARPAPEEAAPPVESGPPLAIHGRWRGSLEGAVTRVSLSGPAARLRGEVQVNGPNGAISAQALGRYDADSARLHLDVDGPPPAGGAWDLDVGKDRLKGTVRQDPSGEILNLNLVRAP